jgi:glycosyltransferase involved in cell wall biosynthesis
MRIAFLCAPTTEAWTPLSAERGIGGSEEAVINLAARLAAGGHEVAVYMVDGANRCFGQVFYGSYDALPREGVDVAVAWRRPIRITQLDRRGVPFGRAYLWLHDNISAEIVAEWRHRFHKIMVLSRFHRSRYAELPDSCFFLTGNGIDADSFGPPNPLRDPFQVVYGSDYGRGLRHLLDSWPAILRALPGAKLNVFYGWQGVERYNPERARRMHQELDPLLRQPGVTHLGRIGHAAVTDQFRRAGVWAYPSSFRETSCITAMKAQAGGAIPAVIPTGALRETVRFGFRTRLGFDCLDDAPANGLVAEWRTGLITLLRSPELQLRIRREMVPASRELFDWSRVAAAWSREFGE